MSTLTAPTCPRPTRNGRHVKWVTVTDAVEIRDVVVRYGDTTAVDGVSLTVPRGRVLSLLGHNGAGKTSLLQVCEGFRRADGGTARVLGLDPVADHDALMPRLGIMLQSGGVYPWATAGEILRLFASFAATARPEAPAAVARPAVIQFRRVRSFIFTPQDSRRAP